MMTLKQYFSRTNPIGKGVTKNKENGMQKKEKTQEKDNGTKG